MNIYCHTLLDFEIDHRALPGGSSMPFFHYHDSYEVYYSISGSKCHTFNDVTYVTNAHEVVIIPPGVVHRSFSPDNLPQHWIIFNFRKEFFDRFADIIEAEGLYDFLEHPKLIIPLDQRLTFIKLINRIAAMNNRDIQEPLNRAIMQCWAFELLTELNRAAKNGADAQPAFHPDIQRAMDYISKSYSSPLTLEELSRRVYLSPSYFSTLFHEQTGMRFNDYLQKYRVERAAELLVSTDDSISSIAQRCGFSGSNYFGDVFRRLTGVSPTEYRKEASPDKPLKFCKPLNLNAVYDNIRPT
ncbi:MAG: helix-turn-helix domain-containing protein [Clostridia bacterium]|nr:helix-turn-helix domain-containing protein [Clostridia bacterium]